MLILVIYLLKEPEEGSIPRMPVAISSETLDQERQKQTCSMVDMQLSKDIVKTVSDEQHSEDEAQALSVKKVQ